MSKAKAKMLRLKDEEIEKVRKKAIEINKKLIRLEKEPIKDSELIHIVIDLGLENIIVNKNGDLEI